MKSSRTWLVVCGALTVLLILCNAAWAYLTVDAAVARTHHEDTLRDTCRSLKQALAILPKLAPKAARSVIVEAARHATADHDEPFEKEGETIVGHLAFRFSPDGALLSVGTIWEPSVCDP